MYSTEQDRINAMISYFFLGPIFLLAKRGTPLAEPYVRKHAKKASTIIAITGLVCFAYFFLVRPYIDFTFLDFQVRTIVFTIIMTFSTVLLLRGAYRAYTSEIDIGGEQDTPLMTSSTYGIANIYGVETEEDKVRILASMLPWIGISISHRYQSTLMEKSRIIASFFTFFILLSFLLTGQVGFLSFTLIVVYIGFFVTIGVYLFIFGRFITFKFFDALPSYKTIEDHTITMIHYAFDFIRTIFGKIKMGTYSEFYSKYSTKPVGESIIAPDFFMPPWLIALPLWNILALPSLFISKYRHYRYLIIQGLTLSLLIGLAIYFGGAYRSVFIAFLIFPCIHLITYAGSDRYTSAPIIGFWIRFTHIYTQVESHLSNLRGNNETIGFRYDTVEPLDTVEKKETTLIP